MAYQVERPPNVNDDNSPRLPNITESRNLMSPLQKAKSPSLKDQAKIWAVDIIQRYMYRTFLLNNVLEIVRLGGSAYGIHPHKTLPRCWY